METRRLARSIIFISSIAILWLTGCSRTLSPTSQPSLEETSLPGTRLYTPTRGAQQESVYTPTYVRPSSISSSSTASLEKPTIPPTSTVAPTSTPIPFPLVIRFPKGATQVSIGCVSPVKIAQGEKHEYRLWLLENQLVKFVIEPTMVTVALKGNLIAPDGVRLGMLDTGSLSWEGRVPQTGRYTLEVVNTGSDTLRYMLSIEAPVEIQMVSQGKHLQGRIIGPCGEGSYLLRITHPLSHLRIRVRSLEGSRLVLEVVGFQDRIPYLRAMMGQSEYEFNELPAQPYRITVKPWAMVAGETLTRDSSWDFVLEISP